MGKIPQTEKPLVLLMKNIISTLTVITLVVTGISPALAFFEENVEDIIAQANSDSVEGVSATAGNGSVILIWNSKKDEEGEEAVGYRVEYGKQSVESGDTEEYEYSEEIDDSIPSTKIEDLTNDTEYFFTVIAIFGDGSETPPSTEVTATPVGELVEEIDDAPIVISAEALSRSQISVVFSEDILLPTENADLAFVIAMENDDLTTIEVLSAAYALDIDTAEEIGSEVILTSADLSAEESYRITASAQITDLNENPIESGSTDNAVFAGSDGDPVDLTPLLVMEGEEEDGGEYEAAPEEESEATPDPFLEELLALDDEEDDGEDELFPWDAEEEDTTPPEDVSNLMASYVARLSDYLVTLTWTPSADTAGDLNDQLYYRSTNGGTLWSDAESLGKTATKKEVSEQPETEITYRITTEDVAGNESVGLIRMVSLPALPATGGPAALIAMGFALAGTSLRYMRKKK